MLSSLILLFFLKLFHGIFIGVYLIGSPLLRFSDFCPSVTPVGIGCATHLINLSSISCFASPYKRFIYCHICGKRQQTQPKRRRLRRAQSQATITKLSGRRENPYWARLPAAYNTSKITRKSLGCYPTYNAAAEALSKAMYAIEQESEQQSKTITMQNMYDRFVDSHYYAALSKSAQEQQFRESYPRAKRAINTRQHEYLEK